MSLPPVVREAMEVVRRHVGLMVTEDLYRIIRHECLRCYQEGVNEGSKGRRKAVEKAESRVRELVERAGDLERRYDELLAQVARDQQS